MPDPDADTETTTDEQTDNPNILPTGGEIHFTDDRNAHAPDRIEFLPGGFVKAIYKRQYTLEVYPPDAIEGIYTHTNHLEDKDWW